MLKTAIIGITGYGKEHLRLLLYGQEHGFLQPCAAVVVNPDECEDSILLLQQSGCRIYDCVEDMWAEEGSTLDLCMIPTPICTHFSFARMALDHGCNVLLEKPLCGTIQEAEELVAYAAKVGKEICVGFQDLYNPQNVELKRRLVAGHFGQIQSIKGWGSWPRQRSYYARNNWAGELKNDVGWVLDSPVNNAMAHFISLMLYWAGSEQTSFGQPVEIISDLFRAQEISSFDTASMRIKTAQGPEIFYAVTHSGKQAHQPAIRVEGDKGWFEWSHCGFIRVGLPEIEDTYPCMDLQRVRERMIEQVWNWCTKGEGDVVTAEGALAHSRIVSALHDSGPIIQLPKDKTAFAPSGRDGFVYVDGLVDLLEEAYKTGRLISEVDPSLNPGTPKAFDLKNYRAFAGGYASKKLPVS